MIVAIVLITENLVERLVLGQDQRHELALSLQHGGGEQLGDRCQQFKRFRIQCAVPIRRRLHSVHVRQRTPGPGLWPDVCLTALDTTCRLQALLPAAGTAWLRARSLPANLQSN